MESTRNANTRSLPVGTVLPADHAFTDGTTLKVLREALVAASLTGMWHVAWEMAYRHGVEKIMCMGCGVFCGPQKATNVQRGNRAIRLCLPCHGQLRVPL